MPAVGRLWPSGDDDDDDDDDDGYVQAAAPPPTQSAAASQPASSEPSFFSLDWFSWWPAGDVLFIIIPLYFVFVFVFVFVSLVGLVKMMFFSLLSSIN